MLWPKPSIRLSVRPSVRHVADVLPKRLNISSQQRRTTGQELVFDADDLDETTMFSSATGPPNTRGIGTLGTFDKIFVKNGTR